MGGLGVSLSLSHPHPLLSQWQVGGLGVPLSPPGLFPAVGLHSLGEEVRLHLPPPGPSEDEGGAMLVDSLEEEWGRLHDVRLCGSVSTREPAGVRQGQGGGKRGAGASHRTGDGAGKWGGRSE